ncbi:hypothetical protein V2G26_011261 [Clonostachys chloroleuca]
MYGLSVDGHAPKILQRCNRFGSPHYAIGLTCVLFPLVYLNVANNTSVVFGWFVNITTVAGLIGWVVIEVTYLRFYAGLKAQGYSRNDIPYRSPFQPYTAWATLVLVLCVIIFSGFDVFVKGHFTIDGFLTCYLNIAIFTVLYLFFKFFLKSKVVPLQEIDFESEFQAMRQEAERLEAEHFEEKKKPLWRRILNSF